MALDGVRAVLLDIDGVLVTSWRAIPGAPEAVAALRRAGIPIRLLTNTTERSRATLRHLLSEAGIDVDDAEILTAPIATAAYLRREHPGARVFLLGTGEASADLHGVDLVEEGPADVVVVGGPGPGPGFTYGRLNRAFRLLMDGASLVAMQRNRYWRTDEGLMLDAGAYVAGLEHAAGVSAVTVGKPEPAMFQAALADAGARPGEAVMVGDDVESDVEGARSAGIRSVLVRTGKYRPGDEARPGGGRDAVIGSIADLPALLGLA